MLKPQDLVDAKKHFRGDGDQKNSKGAFDDATCDESIDVTADGRSDQDAQNDRGCEQGSHITSSKIQKRAGRCGDSDHEIRRRRGGPDRHSAEQNQGGDLKDSASDSQEARHNSGNERDPEPGPKSLNTIDSVAASLRI